MNNMRKESDAIFQELADGMNTVLNAELDKIRAGEKVPFHGSVRKAYGFFILGLDENPNAEEPGV